MSVRSTVTQYQARLYIGDRSLEARLCQHNAPAMRPAHFHPCRWYQRIVVVTKLLFTYQILHLQQMPYSQSYTYQQIGHPYYCNIVESYYGENRSNYQGSQSMRVVWAKHQGAIGRTVVWTKHMGNPYFTVYS